MQFRDNERDLVVASLIVEKSSGDDQIDLRSYVRASTNRLAECEGFETTSTCFFRLQKTWVETGVKMYEGHFRRVFGQMSPDARARAAVDAVEELKAVVSEIGTNELTGNPVPSVSFLVTAETLPLLNHSALSMGRWLTVGEVLTFSSSLSHVTADGSSEMPKVTTTLTIFG
jgi:hypothetical protein